MARITVEDCLSKVNNRFTLIHMAAKRVRQLRKGADPTISSKNKDIVVALREIADSRVIKVEKAFGVGVSEDGAAGALIPEQIGQEVEKASDDEKKEVQ